MRGGFSRLPFSFQIAYKDSFDIIICDDISMMDEFQIAYKDSFDIILAFFIGYVVGFQIAYKDSFDIIEIDEDRASRTVFCANRITRSIGGIRTCSCFV